MLGKFWFGIISKNVEDDLYIIFGSFFRFFSFSVNIVKDDYFLLLIKISLSVIEFFLWNFKGN